MDQHRTNRWQLHCTDQERSHLSVLNQNYCQYSANVGPTNNCYLGHIFWCLVWPLPKIQVCYILKSKDINRADNCACHVLWLLTFWFQNHPANPVIYFKVHGHAFFEILLYTKKTQISIFPLNIFYCKCIHKKMPK